MPGEMAMAHKARASDPRHETDGASPSPAFSVAALYRFANIANPAARRVDLQALCDAHRVCGTLLVAREGINGTIAGRGDDVAVVIAEIERWPGLAPIEAKWSTADDQPFLRMKVRLKREIVALGVSDIDPVGDVGTYVEPADWNALISDPEVVVIDTRNAFEVAIGTFDGAIDPKTEAFSDLPAWVDANLDPTRDRKVAMFCTGGIRCEKATALLASRGFHDVYHLKGGILKYLEDVAEADSLWRGDCFVFDRRVALGHGLEQSAYQVCPICRDPVRTGLSGGVAVEICNACKAGASDEQKVGAKERQRQLDLADARGGLHLGPKAQAIDET